MTVVNHPLWCPSKGILGYVPPTEHWQVRGCQEAKALSQSGGKGIPFAHLTQERLGAVFGQAKK